MNRRRGGLAVLALLTALTGCKTCGNPFDYSGTVVGPNGPNCNFLTRRGSIFAPTDDTPPAGPLEPTPSKTAAPAEELPADAPSARSVDGMRDDSQYDSSSFDSTENAPDASPVSDSAENASEESPISDTADDSAEESSAFDTADGESDIIR